MPINYKEYPKNWLTEIRPAVLHRADNCCEFCGVKNHALIWRYGTGINDWHYWPEGMQSEQWSYIGRKSIKVILTIAHLDHDKMNENIQELKKLKYLMQKVQAELFLLLAILQYY